MIPYISYDRLVVYLGDLDLEVLLESLEKSLIKETKYFRLVDRKSYKISSAEKPLLKVSIIYELRIKNFTDEELEENKKILLDEINKSVQSCLRSQSIIFS